MKSAVVVGVDPGAKGTGVVVASRGKLHPDINPQTVRPLDGTPLAPSLNYLRAVVAEVENAAIVADADLIAVEGIVRPNPHMNRRNGKSLTDPTHILAAAMVFGAVLAHPWHLPIVVVRPGGNGSGLLGQYPPALVSPSERRLSGWQLRQAGSGKLKDQRSAYDVAVIGAWWAKTRHPSPLTYLY